MRFALLLAFAACASPPTHAPPDAGESDSPAVKPCESWLPAEKVANVAIDALTEASGLAASRAQPGVFFSHNDSGNPPELFALDASGNWLGTWEIDGVTNRDWEDVAVGPCSAVDRSECVFLAEIGDNEAVHATSSIVVVRAPQVPATPAKQHLAVERIAAFAYPDGARDAETLLVDPHSARLYVVTKRPVPEKDVRGVYEIPENPSPSEVATARRIGSVVPPPASDGLFTGGSVHPNGRRILLRTYTTVQEYVLPEGAPFESFVQLTPRILDASGAEEQQGEAITYDAAGRAIFTTSEGRHPPLDRRLCSE